ncbi:MAG TPA: hypothetical protein VMW80_08425 [Candidatus Dormibacteraeota bacterium]|nr:hypothetical protein [Candidatus Dormibacteraeota bacterium]
MSEAVFVICAIGAADDQIRKRADDVCDYVIAPVAKEFELRVVRADREVTPGHITTQILQGILRARVIVADLTGRNPNVFYELAFAQSFGKAVVLLVDDAEKLPFDTRNERAIVIGDAGSPISLQQGESAKSHLKAAFEKVLDSDYKPASLITEVAGVASLANLEPENPMAAQLATVKATVEEIAKRVNAPRVVVSAEISEERRQLRHLLEVLVGQGVVDDQELEGLITPATGQPFDGWVEQLRSKNPRNASEASRDIDPDDIPF